MNAGILSFLVSPDLCIIKENLISLGQFLIIFFTPKTGLNLFFVYLPTLFLISIARQHNKTTM
jgi:hypothetical protein